MVRKFKNKSLPRGILIDRGYVFVRIFPHGQRFQKCIGPISSPGIIDLAIAKINEYREQLRTNKFDLDEKAQRLTVEQACEVYWQLHASKIKGARNYRYYLNLIGTYFKGRFVDSLTYLDWQGYREAREKTRKHRPGCAQRVDCSCLFISASTVNREHTAFTAMLNKLKELVRIKAVKPIRLPTENPGSLVKKADEKPLARKRILAVEEFDRLLDAAPIFVRRICLAAVHSTLRFKDLKFLKAANVNRATNQLEGVQAKTGKPYAVPITPVMWKLIETAAGETLFDFTNFRKHFEAARKKANIKDFQFRDLRRTGARTLLKHGVDLATVSKYLGHASIQMTERYVAASKDDLQKAAEVMESKFGEHVIIDAPGEPPVQTVVKTVGNNPENAKAGK